jgi:hypothetical protein
MTSSLILSIKAHSELKNILIKTFRERCAKKFSDGDVNEIRDLLLTGVVEHLKLKAYTSDTFYHPIFNSYERNNNKCKLYK